MNYFSKAQLTTIFSMQAQANSVMSDAWITSTNEGDVENNISAIPYYRASYMEASEAVGHLGFKWWKKETPNIEQAILELVDILHFAASDSIRLFAGNIEAAVSDVIINEESYDPVSNAGIEDFRLGLEFFIERTLESNFSNIFDVIYLFQLFDCKADKIYNMYVGKNALNLFRNKHGQRQNTYVKIWNGFEDNVYLERYFSTLGGEAVDIDNLNSYLEVEYAALTQNQSGA